MCLIFIDCKFFDKWNLCFIRGWRRVTTLSVSIMLKPLQFFALYLLQFQLMRSIRKSIFNIVWQVWFGILPEPSMIGADLKRLLFEITTKTKKVRGRISSIYNEDFLIFFRFMFSAFFGQSSCRVAFTSIGLMQRTQKITTKVDKETCSFLWLKVNKNMCSSIKSRYRDVKS